MASNTSELVIKITGTVDEFKASLGEVAGATEDFSGSLGAIAGLAAAAFAVVSGAIYKSLDAYAESEQASNRLSNALQNQGIYSDLLFQSYKNQANELQHLTGIDNDSIVKGQAQLQSMIGRTQITKEMTSAAVNLGAALGGDVNAGFEVLGRAIDGQTRGLKALGIEVDGNLTKQERTEQILEKVNVAYGGLAEQQNKGLGSMKGLSAAVADIAKDFGQSMAPAVSWATKAITEFFERIHEGNERAKDPFVQLDNQIEAVRQGLVNISRGGTYINVNTGQVISDTKQLNRELDILMAKRDDLKKAGRGASVSQDPAKEKAAREEERIQKDKESREQASLFAHQEAIKAAVEDHTKEVVDIYKEEADLETAIADDKNKNIRGELQDHLQIVRDLKRDGLEQEKQQQEKFDQEFGALHEEADEMSIAQTEAFLAKDAKILKASILTEDQARTKRLTTDLQTKIKAHNTQLLEEQKFGKAYALINKAMHSEVYTGSKQAFGELAQLTQSGNQTLKEIGKVASIANITIKTAEAAMNIYSGFAEIPIVGIALGIAGAAAAVAFGAEQISAVTGAAEGGLITGGIRGVDSVPVLAQQGELIAPAKNFDEVVNAVADKRAGVNTASGSSGGTMGIIISMDGKEAERVLTARTTEAKRLGIYSGI
jgi:hypothetical protein